MITLFEVTYDKYKNSITEKEYNWILSFDPTNNKSYSKWLLSQYIKDKKTGSSFINNKNLNNIFTCLELYDNWKKRNVLEPQYKDVTQFIGGVRDFVQFVNENEEEYNQKIEAKLSKDKVKDAKIWYEDEKVILVTPLSYEASRKYGCNSHWCTASSNPSYFNDYSTSGTLIIHRTKDSEDLTKYTDTGYQIWIPSSKSRDKVQFMDFEDDEVKDEVSRSNLFYHVKDSSVVDTITDMIDEAGGWHYEDDIIENELYITSSIDISKDDVGIANIIYTAQVNRVTMAPQDYDIIDSENIYEKSNRATLTYLDSDVLLESQTAIAESLEALGFNTGGVGLLIQYMNNVYSFEDIKNEAENEHYDDTYSETSTMKHELKKYYIDNFNNGIDYIISNHDSVDDVLFNMLTKGEEEKLFSEQLSTNSDLMIKVNGVDYYIIFINERYDWEGSPTMKTSTPLQRKRDRQLDLDYGF